MKNASFSRILPLLLLLLGLLQRTTAAFPAQIDSDLLIDSTGSQSPWYSQLGEGWLHLQLVAGSSTRYKGAFTDNLDKSTAFPASADVSNASAPVLTIQTHAGKFVFEMQSSFGSSAYGNTTTTSFPPHLGQDASVFVAAYAHQANVIAYNLHLDTQIGSIGSKAYQTGLIVTLLEDGFGYITSRDPETKAVSSLLIPGTHPVSTRITAPGAFQVTDNTNTDPTLIFFTANVRGRLLTFFGHTSNGGAAYDGNVIGSGSGTAAAFGSFHMDKTSGPNPE
jgi:hypothetical protein